MKNLIRILKILLVAFCAATSHQLAAQVLTAPSTSSTGNYTVSSDIATGCWLGGDGVDYCAWLVEYKNNVQINTFYSGSSWTFTGKTSGTYTYEGWYTATLGGETIGGGVAVSTTVIVSIPSTGGGGAQSCTSYPAAPGNMTGYSAGAYSFLVTGASGGGWGTGNYTDDSYLPAMAVHAGLVTVGGQAVIQVTKSGGLGSYTGSTQNGITTSSYGAWGGTYSLSLIQSCGGSPPTSSTPVTIPSFTNQTGVTPSTTVESNTVTVSGFSSALTAQVSGAGGVQMSVNSGGWTTSSSITSGSTVKLRLQAASTGTTGRSATLTIGGSTASWSVTTGAITSNPVCQNIPTAPGNMYSLPAGTYTYLITGATGGVGWGTGNYTDDSNLPAMAVHAGLVAAGSQAVIRVTKFGGLSSYTGSTQNGVSTYSYGSWSGSYSLAAEPACSVAPTVSLTQPASTTDVTLATDVISQPITVTITPNAALTAQVSGDASARLSVDGGASWVSSATVSNNAAVRLKLLSATTLGSSKTATVTVGGVSKSWTVTTATSTPPVISLESDGSLYQATHTPIRQLSAITNDVFQFTYTLNPSNKSSQIITDPSVGMFIKFGLGTSQTRKIVLTAFDSKNNVSLPFTHEILVPAGQTTAEFNSTDRFPLLPKGEYILTAKFFDAAGAQLELVDFVIRVIPLIELSTTDAGGIRKNKFNQGEEIKLIAKLNDTGALAEGVSSIELWTTMKGKIATFPGVVAGSGNMVYALKATDLTNGNAVPPGTYELKARALTGAYEVDSESIMVEVAGTTAPSVGAYTGFDEHYRVLRKTIKDGSANDGQFQYLFLREGDNAPKLNKFAIRSNNSGGYRVITDTLQLNIEDYKDSGTESFETNLELNDFNGDNLADILFSPALEKGAGAATENMYPTAILYAPSSETGVVTTKIYESKFIDFMDQLSSGLANPQAYFSGSTVQTTNKIYKINPIQTQAISESQAVAMQRYSRDQIVAVCNQLYGMSNARVACIPVYTNVAVWGSVSWTINFGWLEFRVPVLPTIIRYVHWVSVYSENEASAKPVNADAKEVARILNSALNRGGIDPSTADAAALDTILTRVFNKPVLRGDLTSPSASADEPSTAKGREYTRLYRVVRMVVRFLRYDLIPDGNIDSKAKELVEVVVCEYVKFSTCSGVGNYTRLSGTTNAGDYAFVAGASPGLQLTADGFAHAGSGLNGGLFVDGRNGQRVLDFRGSEAELNDWVPTDLLNAFGFGTAQYVQARAISQQFDFSYPTNGIYAGHSLGGGLASYGAIRLGRTAYIYNSAGIKMEANDIGDANIEHYHSVFDVLTFIQNFTGIFGGKAVGESHPVWWAGFHNLEPLCKRLGATKCSYPKP